MGRTHITQITDKDIQDIIDNSVQSAKNKLVGNASEQKKLFVRPIANLDGTPSVVGLVKTLAEETDRAVETLTDAINTSGAGGGGNGGLTLTEEDVRDIADEMITQALRDGGIQGEKGDRGPRGEKGEKGDKGDPGIGGANGKSAYEIWKEQSGNAGKTEAQFLASLKGDKGDIGSIKFIPLDVGTQLPNVENADPTAIYLLPSSNDETNMYEEYIAVNGEWEMVGTADVNLDGYVTDNSLTTKLQNYVTNDDLTDAVETALESAKDSGDFDGQTPYIGENGNWWIDGIDTNTAARGVDGKSAYEVWKEQSGNANKTEAQFLASLKGATGAKIVSTQHTATDSTTGDYTYTQTFDNGTQSTFIAPKGPPGPQGPAGSIKFITPSSLPESDIDTTAIYLIKEEGSAEGNLYAEYVYVDNNWERIGQTNVAIDLDQYVTNNDLTTKLQSYVTNGSFADKVKDAITDTTNALTDADKEKAFKWLGIASEEENSLSNELKSATIIGAINELFNEVLALKGFHSKEYMYFGSSVLDTIRGWILEFFDGVEIKDATYEFPHDIWGYLYICVPADVTITSATEGVGDMIGSDIILQTYRITDSNENEYKVYRTATKNEETTFKLTMKFTGV